MIGGTSDPGGQVYCVGTRERVNGPRRPVEDEDRLDEGGGLGETRMKEGRPTAAMRISLELAYRRRELTALCFLSLFSFSFSFPCAPMREETRRR